MSPTPFCVQELVEEIAGYLDLQDLAHCARVSKAWYEVLAPFLHQHVRYDPLSCHSVVTLWSGIQRFGHHIRSLTVTGGGFLPNLDFLGGPTKCRHLTCLSIGPLDHVPRPREWCGTFLALIDHNPWIHTMLLHLHSGMERVLFREYHLLQHLPALRHLTIMTDTYPELLSMQCGGNGVFEAILECGPRLESLVYRVRYAGSRWMVLDEEQSQESPLLAGLGLFGPYEPTWPVAWPDLRSLTLYDEKESRAIELVTHCPNLRRLSLEFLYGWNQYTVLEHLGRLYGSEPSHLEHLEISGLHGQRGEMALVTLLQTCSTTTSQLKSFCLVHSDVTGVLVWSVAMHHTNTLEKLVLIDTVNEYSFDPSLALALCPHLRHVEASVWGGQTWIYEMSKVPWACRRTLRILRLTVCQRDMKKYGGGSPLPNWQRSFWRQMAEVSQLEVLDLEMELPYPPFPRIITVTQDDLDCICSLQRLWELRIVQWQQTATPLSLQHDLETRRPNLKIDFCGLITRVDCPDEWPSYP
ncbi:hypothetical protein B0O80DRAFT_430010 [Mortierella sp. GBAus27b]|nr:hypothetical protein B0O80DRAFT_430010 [Mortierella sp. GBAus27b]